MMDTQRVPVPGFGFLKPESRDYIEKTFQVSTNNVKMGIVRSRGVIKIVPLCPLRDGINVTEN